MLKPDLTAQIIIFGEASKLQEVSDFLRQNYTKSKILIFDKNRLNSEEIEKLEFLESASAVIYIEEEQKADFGIKAAFLDKAIAAKAAIFTLPLQDWKKNVFHFNEFQLQDLYKIDKISPSKLPQKNKYWRCFGEILFRFVFRNYNCRSKRVGFILSERRS